MYSMQLSEACQPSVFSSLSIFGTEVLSLQAAPVTNYTVSAPAALRLTQPSIKRDDVSFCNITVTYTHPGQNDVINVETWLPLDWNERLQAVGGGGWVAGRFIVSYKNMEGALADGYATVTTDAGIELSDDLSWGLLSEGNVDLYNIQNFASVPLVDEAQIAKSLIRSFYGKGAKYSYWNGCSQGGRQGLMLAQRYPEAYNGIAAGAPAINFAELQPSIYWPQYFMRLYGSVPHPCEIDRIRAAAVEACDGLDGVVDGIISEPSGCLNEFNPFTVIGQKAQCGDNSTHDVSQAAAAIVNATWRGMATQDGRKTGFGFSPAADLTGNDPLFAGTPGPLAIDCKSEACVGQPNPQLTQWFSVFLAADQSLDAAELSHADFDHLVHLGVQRYQSLLGTADPDLSTFRDLGGKMITYHGLSDNVIPAEGTEQYYKEVSRILPDVQDFYRYFEAPGLGHCMGGSSGQPEGLFGQLRGWVENGTVPEKTVATLTNSEGRQEDRIWCPYPQKAMFDADCGDTGKLECWKCR